MNTAQILTLPSEKLAFTVFDTLHARIMRPQRATWDEICETIESIPQFASKHECNLLKLATFGDKRTKEGSLRSNDNMLTICGIEGDYDGGKVSLEEAETLLRNAGVECCLYTTPSHTPDAPRWRVLAPLSRTYAPGDRKRFVERLNHILGGVLANESLVPSQAFYIGRVAGVPYDFVRVHGQPIDLVEVNAVADMHQPATDRSSVPPLFDGAEIPAHLRIADVDDLTRSLAVSNTFPDVYLPTPNNVKIVRDMLACIPPDNGTPNTGNRGPWLQILFSVASLLWGNVAEELCRNWSMRGLYDEQEFNTAWRSYNPNRKGYSIGTLIRFAKEAGYAGPSLSPSVSIALPEGDSPAGIAGSENQYDALVDRTDAGNANLLVEITQGNLRFVPERQLWLYWDGERWIEDAFGSRAQHAALRVARHYHRKSEEIARAAADGTLDDHERKRIMASVDSMNKWATHCRNKRALDSMLAIASKNPAVQLHAAELNKNPFLFGVANGVVDLRTGELRSAAREDFVTKRSPVKFVPSAKAPRWVQFIEEITGEPIPAASTVGAFNKRPQLGEYLQRGLGYSITGLTTAQKMFICIGSGSNGKNVLLDLFQWITGDYCQTIPPEVLMTTRHDTDAERPSPTAASLAGARAAISSESKDGQKLDVAMVKRHTGGGYMTARMMRENPFRFEITHKLWLMTNAKPALDHLDDAIRGRLHLIPFDRKWNRPDEAMRNPALPDGDGNLKSTLESEAEGILAWLVQGAVKYFQDELQPPPDVLRVTNEYFYTQDALTRWLEEYERCPPKDGTSAARLWTDFNCWCSEEGMTSNAPNNMKTFGLALTALGIQGKKLSDGKYYGLRKKAAVEDADFLADCDAMPDDGC